MEHNVEVVIDNGGGLTVQCDSYVHSYEGPSDASIAEAGTDVLQLLGGEDPAEWDGNEPEHRINYTYEQVKNGSYDVFSVEELRAIVKAPYWRDVKLKGGAMGREFARFLYLFFPYCPSFGSRSNSRGNG